jgi:AcrR family transcriptional regulator
MYHGQGLSMAEIARLAGTTKSHVHYYMTKFDIGRRPWTGLVPKVDPRLILSMYRDQGKTLREISAELHISRSTAWTHVADQTQMRPRSAPRFSRVPFSGDEFERSYLIGYRAGDVNAFQDSAQTVTARVSTTHPAMLEMFSQCFSHYGRCKAVPRQVFLTGYDWQILVYLDDSFRFLIPKPSSPPSEPVLVYAFIAGFSDSDGCWAAYERRGRTAFSFCITSRNHVLLVELESALEREGYHPHLYLSREKGTTKVVKGRYETRVITLTEDTWTLVISRCVEVKKLAFNVLPYSRHREKIAKMKLVLDGRNDVWVEMGPKFEQLRRNIRMETGDSISRAEIEYKARHEEPALGVVG